jgi:hypothetical protein
MLLLRATIRWLVDVCWNLVVRDRRFIGSWLSAPGKEVLYSHLDVLIAMAVHSGFYRQM